MKTVNEDKRENNLNIYTSEIAPKFIKKLCSSIEGIFSIYLENFVPLIDNLQTPYYNKPEEIIQSIIFKDKQRLTNSYHQTSSKGDPSKIGAILNPSKVIRNFTEDNNVFGYLL